jgi:5-(carboxyamino)imidazole ribonucleotide synthase
MGEGKGRRVVVTMGGGSLSHMLGEEVRRKGLPCDVVVDPSAAEKKTLDAPTRISVILARSATGEIRTYPAAENLYEDGLLRTTIVPGRLDAILAQAADAAAREAVKGVEGAGVFAVEMTPDVKNLVVVPGVHNTGHYTIEACRTSQYEQHVRAVSGADLGETTLLYAAVTIKLYGAPGMQGPYVLEGLDGIRSIPGVTVHLYGAKETAPRRALGHVTLVGVSHPAYLETLIHRADAVRKMIILKESKR